MISFILGVLVGAIGIIVVSAALVNKDCRR